MQVDEALSAVYSLVQARKGDHFIFTSSGAEGVNHVVLAAYLDLSRKTGKNHFVCGALDEAPAILAMSRLSELGCLHEMAPASREGVVTAQAVAETITPRTALVSLSWGNALTGVIQPVAEIAALCRDRGILFHVEASAVLGKGYYPFEECGADILTFDGPSGTGGVFIREGVEMSPMILGGSEQGHMRAGSINVSGLNELAKWAKESLRFRDHFCMEVTRLRDRFEKIVGTPLFKEANRLPHISAHLFPGCASDALFYLLSRRSVRSSFGGNHLQHMMHLLQACGFEERESQCGLSFTFSEETGLEEIETYAERILEAVNQLKNCSEGVYNEF